MPRLRAGYFSIIQYFWGGFVVAFCSRGWVIALHYGAVLADEGLDLRMELFRFLVFKIYLENINISDIITAISERKQYHLLKMWGKRRNL